MSLCAGATIADERAVIVPVCERLAAVLVLLAVLVFWYRCLCCWHLNKTKFAATAVTGSEKQIVKKIGAIRSDSGPRAPPPREAGITALIRARLVEDYN